MTTIHQAHAYFGMCDGRNRSIGALVAVRRYQGKFEICVIATRTGRPFGATPQAKLVTDVDEVNAEIGRRVRSMFKRYLKTSDRYERKAVEDLVAQLSMPTGDIVTP